MPFAFSLTLQFHRQCTITMIYRAIQRVLFCIYLGKCSAQSPFIPRNSALWKCTFRTSFHKHSLYLYRFQFRFLTNHLSHRSTFYASIENVRKRRQSSLNVSRSDFVLHFRNQHKIASLSNSQSVWYTIYTLINSSNRAHVCAEVWCSCGA